jgi:hypothetical protein
MAQTGLYTCWGYVRLSKFKLDKARLSMDRSLGTKLFNFPKKYEIIQVYTLQNTWCLLAMIGVYPNPVKRNPGSHHSAFPCVSGREIHIIE